MQVGPNEWSAEEETEDGFGFQDLIAITRRRLKLICTVIAVCLGFTIGATFMLPNQYVGTATIQLEPRGKKIVEIDSVIKDLKGDTPTIESEVEIVRSTAILSQVADILKLRTDGEFTAPSNFTRILQSIGLSSARPAGPRTTTISDNNTGFDYLGASPKPGTTAPQQDDLTLALAKRLKVYRVRNTLLINIEFESRSPAKAAQIANTIAEVYIRTQLKAKRRANSEATTLLRSRVEGLRRDLTIAETKLERFKSANNIFDSEGHLLFERQLTREMEAIVRVRDETARAQAKYEQARRLMLQGNARESVADVLQSPMIRLLRDGLSKALRNQAELQTKYGPRHPEMEKSSADVAKAQNNLTAEINKIIKNLRTEYLVARQRQEQLESHLQRLKSEVGTGKEAQGAYRELLREVSATKQLYEAMLGRMKQVAETTTLQFADARIIQRADIPAKPSGPKRKKLVLLAFAGSLALSFGLALLLEFAQPGFVRPEDVERALDLPQIAAFPLLSDDTRPEPPLRPMRLMLSEPDSAFAESTRALRYEIDARRPHDATRLIMIASALPDEGKSIVASNLAHYMALSGTRTLLIDGDLRRGKLSETLGLNAQPGFLEAITNNTDPLEFVLTDKTSGLHVLPAMFERHGTISAPELLSQRGLQGALDQLRPHFDNIIIDAPPLLPVVDARLLANYTDQIVLVMTWRKTPKDIAKRALKLLGRNQSKVTGVVINRVDPAEHRIGLGYASETPLRNARPVSSAA